MNSKLSQTWKDVLERRAICQQKNVLVQLENREFCCGEKELGFS